MHWVMFPPQRRYHHIHTAIDRWSGFQTEIVAILVHYQPSCNTSHTMKVHYVTQWPTAACRCHFALRDVFGIWKPGRLILMTKINLGTPQKCTHFSTSTWIACTDYGHPVRKSPSTKHILTATSAQIFRFLWFMPSLGVRSPCYTVSMKIKDEKITW